MTALIRSKVIALRTDLSFEQVVPNNAARNSFQRIAHLLETHCQRVARFRNARFRASLVALALQ
jgi:hypothetical protein